MRSSVLVLLLTACQPEGGGDVPSTGTPGGGTPTGTLTGPTTGTPTTGSTTTPTTPFDCAAIPTSVPPPVFVDGASGYHDVAFTEGGWILGNNRFNQHIVGSDGAGGTTTLVSGIGQVQGLEWLPSGELAVASDATGAILKIDPTTGQQSVLSPNVYAYGLMMGPDGKLWSANNNIVQRHDLTTGGSEPLITSLPAGGARAINFSPDNTRLYIVTNFGDGRVYKVDLDANFDPVGGPVTLAEGVGDGAYQDGLGVDVCGYLYVPDYGTRALYRVSPDGSQVQELYPSALSEYGHGLEWGNGTGPWRTDAIYLPLPYGQNQVIELDLGIPKEWDGPVLNAPPAL